MTLRTLPTSSVLSLATGLEVRRSRLLGQALAALATACGALQDELSRDEDCDPGSLAQLQSGVTICADGNKQPGIEVSYYQGAINRSRIADHGRGDRL